MLVSEDKYKAIKGKEIKILAPKNMLQRLKLARAHIKVGNISENLLNEIIQIAYLLH